MPDWFTVAEVWHKVCALDDWRSRPAVALRVRLRASPSAQDDTKGGNGAQSLDLRRICWIFGVAFKVRIYAGFPALFFSLKLIKSLLLWEKGDHGSGG